MHKTLHQKIDLENLTGELEAADIKQFEKMCSLMHLFKAFSSIFLVARSALEFYNGL